jgi:hypothetical protein
LWSDPLFLARARKSGKKKNAKERTFARRPLFGISPPVNDDGEIDRRQGTFITKALKKWFLRLSPLPLSGV